MTLLRLALAVVVATSGVAHAAIFCVADETALRQALSTAAANNQDDDIRLHARTFFTGGQKFSMSSTEARSLSISGGWSDTPGSACSTQSRLASATVLDGQNLTPVLDITAYAFAAGSAGATVSLSNLTLRNGYTTANSEPAGLRLAVGFQTLRLERTILVNHHQAGTTANIYNDAVALAGNGDIYMLNNVLGNLQSIYANLAIFTDAASQTVFLNNNTLSLGGGGFHALLDASNGTAFRLVNNAIMTPGSSLAFNSRNANDRIRLWMFNNAGSWGFTGLFNGVAVQADSGNRTGIDPMFLGPTDFRPAAGSPLANGGINAPFGGVPALDLDGNARVDLGIIDIGAYESTRERVFAHGFE